MTSILIHWWWLTFNKSCIHFHPLEDVYRVSEKPFQGTESLNCSVVYVLPFQAWIYHCHLHSLQAANCRGNSRLAVHENDKKWVANEKNCRHYWNSSIQIFVLKKMKLFFADEKWCIDASWEFKRVEQVVPNLAVVLRGCCCQGAMTAKYQQWLSKP